MIIRSTFMTRKLRGGPLANWLAGRLTGLHAVVNRLPYDLFALEKCCRYITMLYPDLIATQN